MLHNCLVVMHTADSCAALYRGLMHKNKRRRKRHSLPSHAITSVVTSLFFVIHRDIKHHGVVRDKLQYLCISLVWVSVKKATNPIRQQPILSTLHDNDKS